MAGLGINVSLSKSIAIEATLKMNLKSWASLHSIHSTLGNSCYWVWGIPQENFESLQS